MSWKTSIPLLVFLAAAAGCSHEGDRLSGGDLPPGHPDAAAAAQPGTGVPHGHPPLGGLPPGHPPMGGTAGKQDAGLPPGHPPTGGLPAGHPPMGHDPTGMAGKGLTAAQAAELRAKLPIQWIDPEGWASSPPSNNMRAAQYTVAEGVECVLYGGIGGTDQENIDRWVGFFQQPDGRPSSDVAQVTETESEGIRIKRVEVSGTFAGQVMPGQTAPEDPERMALLGACITSPEGHKFHAKLQGPAEVVEAAKPVFDAWLKSLRPQPRKQ